MVRACDRRGAIRRDEERVSNVRTAAATKESSMEIQRSGSKPSGKGPAEFFTGSVRIDPLIATTPPARLGGAVVTFEPGARSAWHTHPLGQMLVVTAGCGLVQSAGGPVVKIRPGDVVWCPPGEKHWHGATAYDRHVAPRAARKPRRQERRMDGAGDGPRVRRRRERGVSAAMSRHSGIFGSAPTGDIHRLREHGFAEAEGWPTASTAITIARRVFADESLA